MRCAQVYLAVICAFALLAHRDAVHALPHLQTYGGVSRYEYKHAEVDDIQQDQYVFPNPREHPEFYNRHHSDDFYLSQGFVSDRPAWAQRMLDNVVSLVEQVGLESWSMFKLLSPYFSTKEYVDLNAFQNQQSSSVDDAYLASLGRDDVEQNDTISAMPNLPQDSGFDYKKDKVRGVNIGNWLLFELWMDSDLAGKLNSRAVNAPGPNAIVDEWTAGLYSDKKYAADVLRSHFDTWFTEQDMIEIKQAGLNHVRIPFPYWGFAEAKGNIAPYLTLNRFDKLVEACGWARKHGVKVWVDIHGVPGSQNGFDNSGRSGPIHWPNNRDYYKRTQYTFQRLAQYFSADEWKGTVTGIEAVNEPQAANNGAVKSLIEEYYPWARNVAAKPTGKGDFSSLLLIMHDGFLGPLHWEGFFTGRASHRVLLDTHPYYVYGDGEKRAKDSSRLREVCAKENTFRQSQRNYPTIAGEWSVSGPNGDRAQDRDLPRAPFAFPDGPNYPYSKRYMAFMARNFAVQQQTYERGSGWIFWSWYNRNAKDWSYKTGLKYGWIPKDAGAPSPFGKDPCANYR